MVYKINYFIFTIMKDDEFTNKESLALIETMIVEARGSVKSNQFYFILWGWVIAGINLFVFISQTYFDFEYAQMAWIICFPLGIITAIHATRATKKRKVKTHLDKMFSFMWMAYFITIIILVGAAPKLNFQMNALTILITGFPTIITGVAIKFKPLIYGGASFWIMSVIAFSLPLDQQNLIGALAIIIGYLIPGYLLKRKERNESI